jgi:serine/threonine-protein kinase
MAPEQADSKGPPVTFKADLFALGLIAFRLLTGRRYWEAGSLAQLFAQVLVGPMPPPSERGATLGPAFDRWFLRACDRDPRWRFESAHEQVEALAVALGFPEQPPMTESGARKVVPAADATGTSASTITSTTAPWVASHARTPGLRWLAVGLLAAVLALGTAVALGRHRAPASAAALASSAPDPAAPVPSSPSPGASTGSAPTTTVVFADLTTIDAAAASAPASAPARSGAAPAAAKAKPSGAGRSVPAPASTDSIWGER